MSEAMNALKAFEAKLFDEGLRLEDWPEWQRLRNALSRWIPVSERAPEGRCIVYLEREAAFSQVHGANFRDNVKTIGGQFYFDMPKVTHWMPLPEPPCSK